MWPFPGILIHLRPKNNSRLSWTLPHAPILLAYFNLYLFNKPWVWQFSAILWAIPVNYQNRMILRTPDLEACVRHEGGLVNFQTLLILTLIPGMIWDSFLCRPNASPLRKKKPQFTKNIVEQIITYVFLYSGPLKADSRGEDLWTFLQPIPILYWWSP